MKYRNIKTGAVIDVRSECGGDWVPVEAKKKNTTSQSMRKATSKK